MNMPNLITIKQRAHHLLRQEISRRLHLAIAAINDWLREQHEAALRRPQRVARMRPANATPA